MISIIAEPDISWAGDSARLTSSIDRAAWAGVDIYKLQLFNPSMLGDAWSHKYNFYFDRRTTDEHIALASRRCGHHGISLMATVNHIDQVKRCKARGIRMIKVASGQLEEDLLAEIAKYEWDLLVVSTGMALMTELNRIKVIPASQRKCLMHCVSLYPSLETEINIKRMDRLVAEFPGWVPGYSDHYSGISACVGAMWRGAKYIEKHFHNYEDRSPVHRVACNPGTLDSLCLTRDTISNMLGDGSLSMRQRETITKNRYEQRWKI